MLCTQVGAEQVMVLAQVFPYSPVKWETGVIGGARLGGGVTPPPDENRTALK